jgi:sugar (pentulose or hexulose) kinase
MTHADAHRADDRLKALFALDEPAPRDTAFSAAVMEKVMRQRFREEVAMLSGVTVIGGGALWLVWPTLQAGLVTVSQSLAPAAGAAALAACATLVAGLWRPSPAHVG